jgi:hypothetical protein
LLTWIENDSGRQADRRANGNREDGVAFECQSCAPKEGDSMPRNLHGRIGRSRLYVMQSADEHPVVLAGSAFVLGLAMGLLLRDVAKRMFKRTRERLWHRDYEQTVTYDDNLPDSLTRREPLPYPGQPRFGSTGALGVPPTAAGSTRPEEKPQA